MQSLRELGGVVVLDPDNDLLLVNGMLSASIVLCRCQRTAAGGFRWLVRFDEGLRPDITVAVRMDAGNEAALDYYLLPSLDITGAPVRIREDNGAYLDTYRFDTLDYFFGMAELVPLGEAA